MDIKVETTNSGRGSSTLMYLVLAVFAGLFTGAIVRGMSAAADEHNEFVTMYKTLGTWAIPAAIVCGLLTILFLLLLLGSIFTSGSK